MSSKSQKYPDVLKTLYILKKYTENAGGDFGLPLYICARRDKYDFLPSHYCDVEKNMSLLISAIYQKRRVVIPVIFYPCKSDDIISQLSLEDVQTSEFHVVNHINTLYCYPTPDRFNEITIERYEPSCCFSQGNLDDILRSMFSYWFDRQKQNQLEFDAMMNWASTIQICPRGTQVILKDINLCQYHILWWIKHRLHNTFWDTYVQIINNFDRDKFMNYVKEIESAEKYLG